MNSDLDTQIRLLCDKTLQTRSLDNLPFTSSLSGQMLEEYEKKRKKYEELFLETDSRDAIRIVNVRELLNIVGDEEFISSAYKRLLGRRADAEGLKTWTDALKSGTHTRADVLLEMAACPEGAARNIHVTGFTELSLPAFDRYSGRDYVSNAYILLLGRPADASGMEQYLAQLRGNLITKEEFLYILQHSAEGEAYAPRITGLEEAYRKRQKRKKLLAIPVLGRAIRFILNLLRANRRMNVSDARFYALQDSLEQKLSDLTRELEDSLRRERELEGQLDASLCRIRELEKKLDDSDRRGEKK